MLYVSTLLNSANDNTNKFDVERFLVNTSYKPVIFRKSDIATGSKATKCGKACCVDRRTSSRRFNFDHFIHAI